MPLVSAAPTASRWRVSSSSIWRSRTSVSLPASTAFDVRLVDPLQAPVGAAQPSRHGQGVEQRPAGQGVAHELPVLIEDPGEVALAPCDVAQPQDRPSAGRPAVRLDVAASRTS